MKIKVTYIACDYDNCRPIISAESFENLRLALDNYCGADHRNLAKCNGFFPYNTKYPDYYEGYFEYECLTNNINSLEQSYLEKFKVFCVEFYPETKY